MPDIYRLSSEVERGQRVVQPRLRHRYQVDRHGLARSTHRLLGEGEDSASSSRTTARRCSRCSARSTPSSASAPTPAHAIAAVLHRALRWNGPVGPSLIAHLAGGSGARASLDRRLVDPVAWALDVLGFPPGTDRAVQAGGDWPSSARRLHGGASRPRRRRDRASKAIVDLGEARRILLALRWTS